MKLVRILIDKKSKDKVYPLNFSAYIAFQRTTERGFPDQVCAPSFSTHLAV